MDQFYSGLVVWASARGDIFWPGQVVEPDKDAAQVTKKCVTINFLVEDSYEVIRNPSKIFIWNCEKQNKFIERGRGIKNLEKKVQFNKAVAEADDLFMQQAKKGDDMSLHENGEGITKLPAENKKGQSNKKKRCSGAGPTPLRTSPRRTVANENLTSNVENQSSRLAEGQHTKKETATLKRGYPTSGLQTKSNESNSSLECDVKRKRTVQGQATKTASAEKTDDRSECLQAQCNGHQKAKRRLIDDKSPKKTATKKSKPCHQVDAERPFENGKGVELSSKRTFKENGVKNNELKMSSVNNLDYSAEVADKESEITAGINSSVSSDVSSDDELLSDAFSPSQEANQFSVGDIVWAKYYREPYWPAQIKRIAGKRKQDQKFLVKFLAWHNCLFKVQPKKMVHFACDPSQRAEFKDIVGTLKNKELEDLFEEAVIEAEDLLNRKGLGKSLDEDFEEDDLQIFEEKEDDNTEQDDKPMAIEDLSQQTSSLFECRKSLRAKKQVSKYSNIMSYIRQAKPFLRQILNGTKRSERHKIYTSGRVSEKDQLKHRAGFGPIGDGNLREEIMEALLEFYKELKGNADLTYVSDVWLPEAVIFSIQKIDNVKRERAEEMYLTGSEIAVSSSEVLELTKTLKQKKLSPEQTAERIEKAKRAIARCNDES